MLQPQGFGGFRAPPGVASCVSSPRIMVNDVFFNSDQELSSLEHEKETQETIEEFVEGG